MRTEFVRRIATATVILPTQLICARFITRTTTSTLYTVVRGRWPIASGTWRASCLRPWYSAPCPVAFGRRRCPVLRKVWGNRGYTADLQYLRAVLHYAQKEQGPILECGSGLTTLLLGLTVLHSVWSLEHMAEWFDRVHARLGLAGTGANVSLTALRSYGSFEWYDIPAALPHEFRLVICDGPPGNRPGGRYGLLPLLGERLLKGTVILLDDAERSEEQLVLQRWKNEAGWTHTIEVGAHDAYAVVTV